MKNHIVVKFVAIVLCAASLLGVLGGAGGILVLMEANLYQKTAGEAYTDTVENYAQSLAGDVALKYAAEELGGASPVMVESLYGSAWYYDAFHMGRVGYVLYDENGNVLLEAPMDSAYRVKNSFTFYPVNNYPVVLWEMTEEEYQGVTQPLEGITTQIGEEYVYNAVPEAGVDVYQITVDYDNGNSEGVSSAEEPIGRLFYDHQGNVAFLSPDETLLQELSGGTVPIHILFLTADDTCVYEASSPFSVIDSCNQGSQLLMTLRNPETSAMIYDAIPADGCAVTRVSVTYADDFSESTGGAPDIGYLDYDQEGRVRFVPYNAGAFTYKDVPVTHIAFYDDANDALVYEARDPEGIGWFFYRGGELIFLADRNVNTDAPVEETHPDTTEPVAETEKTFLGFVEVHTNIYSSADLNSPVVGFVTVGNTLEIIPQDDGIWGWIPGSGWVLLEGITLIGEDGSVYIPDNGGQTPSVVSEEPVEEVTVPVATEVMVTEAAEEEILIPATEPVVAAAYAGDPYSYYDYTTGQRMYVEYRNEPLPAYRVEVQLAEGAFRYEHEWVLIRTVYALREELPYILAVSLLLFAVFAVYLCCAAGRRPGTKEVRAAGLNCIPLELYGLISGCGVAGLAVGGVEGTRLILRYHNAEVGAMFVLLCTFLACLLVVGFCFACAAQFKTPGRYWLRNSLTGRGFRLIASLCRLTLKFVQWISDKWEIKLWPWMVRLCKGIFKVVKVLLQKAGQGLLWLVDWLRSCGDWMGRKLHRFFSMLPVTWQWLLSGGAMIFFLFIAVAGRYDTGIILSILFAVGLIIYGAHCFGTLLESAKRMSKGDLDEKVDEKLMAGSFREFAGELNSLADVAVVAAQKQLKSERMKTELITNVSHDIKTPLTSIINYVDLLRKPHSPEDQEKYLEVLDRQSQRLKKLIDDLMEMSKASTGNLAVDIVRVDAAEAVNQALGEFADKLEKAQLIPVFRQPEEQILMMADGRLVWRVMSNLLSNAVKYALPGTRIYVDLQKLENKVIISMKNISREELNVEADELLERFVRGDVSRNTEGSGLGLNIAQSLMQLQKGQLQILVDGDLFKVTMIFPSAE